jgi:hypothetical protein
VVEFEPDTGKTTRLAGISSGSEFEAQFNDGNISSLSLKTRDGLYSENLSFSGDGKTITFNSQETTSDDLKESVERNGFLTIF